MNYQYLIQYQDDAGQWQYPGDEKHCSFETEGKALEAAREMAKIFLESDGDEFVPKWRLIERNNDREDESYWYIINFELVLTAKELMEKYLESKPIEETK